MVYLSDSNVLQGRSWWSLSTLTDTFWSILNFLVLYVMTLVSPGYNKDKHYSTDYRRSGRVDRGRKLGRIGGWSSSSPPPPPMGGGG